MDIINHQQACIKRNTKEGSSDRRKMNPDRTGDVAQIVEHLLCKSHQKKKKKSEIQMVSVWSSIN
jgi:hypothetical protein